MRNLLGLGVQGARGLTRAALEQIDPQRRREVIVALASTLPEAEKVRLAVDLDPRRETLNADHEAVLALVRDFLSRTDSEGAFRLSEGMFAAALTHQASVEHVIEVYSALARTLADAGGQLRGARILELGPGHSLLGGILLLAWGAAEYHGVDAFPIARCDAARVRALRERLAGPQTLPIHEEALAARREEILARFDEVVRIEGEEVVLDEARLQIHCPVDAAALPFSGESYDFVCSNAVLEHVTDVENTAKEAARVLAPGGISIHQVDFRDHRDFASPRRFLEVSREEWIAFLADRPFEYTNRLRVGETKACFLEAGFELLSLDINEVKPLEPGERERLHAEFRNYSQEDLEALGGLFVLRKPGA